MSNSKLIAFKKESSKAKRIILSLGKTALKSVPVLGNIVSLLDEGILDEVQSIHQDAINKLVEHMYDSFEPILRKHEEEELNEGDFLEQLKNKCIPELDEFAQKIQNEQDNFLELINFNTAEIKKLNEKIDLIAAGTEELSSSLVLKYAFTHIGDSVSLHLNCRGCIDNLYEDLESVSRSGGQGEIFRAYKKGNRSKKIILKVLKVNRAHDSKSIERFLLEGYLGSQLIHENIVRIIDYGGFIESYEFFIEMEDLGDESLKAWCKENPFNMNSNLEEYIDIFTQCTNSIEFMHNQNIIHRDIKPANFMYCDGTIKLIDFGCIKFLDNQEISMTVTGESIGTPAYMSPEQFNNTNKNNISAACDIYSLGVMFYEIITGRLPFIKNTFFEYGTAHASENVLPPSKYVSIPDWLDSLVLSMLKKQANTRIVLNEVKIIIENNRKENIEEAINNGNQLLVDLFTSDNIESKTLEITALQMNLKGRLLSASPELKDSLKKFILKCEQAIQKIKKRDVLDIPLKNTFNPLTCPNLECDEVLQTKVKECPKCKTSWLIDCPCEKEEKTPYSLNECQKCIDKCAITLINKQKYSLFISVDLACENKEYLKAISYFGYFLDLKDDPDVIKKKSTVDELYKKIEKEQLDGVTNELLEEQKKLNAKKNREARKREQKIVEEINKKRYEHIIELKKIVDNEEYNNAIDYYTNTFPDNLKNTESEAIYEEVCDYLIKSKLDDVEKQIEKEDYESAQEILKKIPQIYLSSKAKSLKNRVEELKNIKEYKGILVDFFDNNQYSDCQEKLNELLSFGYKIEDSYILNLQENISKMLNDINHGTTRLITIFYERKPLTFLIEYDDFVSKFPKYKLSETIQNCVKEAKEAIEEAKSKISELKQYYDANNIEKAAELAKHLYYKCKDYDELNNIVNEVFQKARRNHDLFVKMKSDFNEKKYFSTLIKAYKGAKEFNKDKRFMEYFRFSLFNFLFPYIAIGGILFLVFFCIYLYDVLVK